VTGAAARAGGGWFITFEGGEGAGKSTQIAALAAWLQQQGRAVLTTREPGGTPGAEEIRRLLVEGQGERWSGVTELLLHFAARRDHLERCVWPALEAGSWVVCDRFADSTRAYQGYGHGLPLDIIEQLYRLAVGDFAPDLTVILDVPPTLGLTRAATRRGSEGRYETFDITFHDRVAAGFRTLAADYPERCVLIDAAAPADIVSQAVIATVLARLPGGGLNAMPSGAGGCDGPSGSTG